MLIKKLKNCKKFTAGDGTFLREIFNPRKENLKPRYSLAYAVLKSGRTSLPHKLKVSEVYYILHGRGTMCINGEKRKIFENYTIYIPPDSVQFIKNTGKTDLIFLCIVDPAWRKKDEKVLKK